MRLLDTETGQFVEFTDPFKITYAILSHTWDLSGEQSYQELREIQKCFPESKRTSPFNKSTHSTREETLAQESSPLQTKETKVPSDSRTHIESRLLSLLIIPLSFLILWLLCAPCVCIWDHPGLSPKIRRACAIARAHGYRYIWIDSCYIDKTSSSELSEAINSMFAWYRDAAVCYAFLADVPDRGEERPGLWEWRFQRSNWFTRGWTLQELIAPRTVVFLSQEWRILGTKSTLLEAVQSATRIQPEILTHSQPLSSVSVAARMSWAAWRKTTRVEDHAYSLLGIFDINMPTLYGEGHRAFLRLQEEILRRIPDQSLFAWNIFTYHWRLRRRFISQNPDEIESEMTLDSTFSMLLPPLVVMFASTELAPVRPLAHDIYLSRLGLSDLPVPEYTITPHGIRTQIPLIPIRDLFPERSLIVNKEGQSEWSWYLAILACESESDDGSLMAFVCGEEPSPSPLRLLQYGSVSVPHGEDFHLVALSPAEIERCRPHMRLETAYLSLSDSKAVSYLSYLFSGSSEPSRRAHLDLSGWAKAVLLDQGYEVRFLDSNPMRSNSDADRYCAVELVKGVDTISIRCYYELLESSGASFFVALSVSYHDASQATPHPRLWKNFENDLDIARPHGGCLIERLRATLRNSAGDTLVVRLSVEHVSEDSIHLHVEVIGEGNSTEGSSGNTGEVQDEEMKSDYELHEKLQEYERALFGSTGELQDEETDFGREPDLLSGLESSSSHTGEQQDKETDRDSIHDDYLLTVP